MSKTPFKVQARFASFSYAIAGLGAMLRGQHNAWIHLAATVAVVIAALGLRVSATDWRWLILCVALVWMAEAVNTAIEHVCDVVSPERRDAVRLAKDIAAGAVLIVAIAATLIGALVFWPYVF